MRASQPTAIHANRRGPSAAFRRRQEGVRVLQTILFVNSHIVECDHRILNRCQSDFVLELRRRETGRRWRRRSSFDLAVGDALRPNHCEVAEGYRSA